MEQYICDVYKAQIIIFAIFMVLALAFLIGARAEYKKAENYRKEVTKQEAVQTEISLTMGSLLTNLQQADKKVNDLIRDVSNFKHPVAMQAMPTDHPPREDFDVRTVLPKSAKLPDTFNSSVTKLPEPAKPGEEKH